MAERKENLAQPPRHLKGNALTEYLENNPDFIALLAAAKGGEQELPAYLRMRLAEQAHSKEQK